MTTLPYSQLIAEGRAGRHSSALARAARAGTARASALAPEEEEEDRPFFDAKDLLLAPVRGVGHAAGNAWGLVDTLAGDALPDYEERYLGRSRSVLGGFVEGVFQFATGFIPGLGIAGKVGQVAGLAGKASPLVAGLAKTTVAGAIADFTVFDGHEERLSNLIQSFPHLEHPITSYLASDESDSQLEGRFKNMLEGAGLGLLTDAVFQGVKGVRAARKARLTPGATPETVAAAVDEVVDPVAISTAVRAAREEGSLTATAAARPDADTELTRALDPHVSAVEDDLARTPAPTTGREVLEDMGFGNDALDAVLAETDRMTELGLEEAGSAGVPRRMSKSERLQDELTKGDLNLDNFQGPAAVHKLLRSVDVLAQDALREEWDELNPQDLTRVYEDETRRVADILGASKNPASVRSFFEEGRASVLEAGSFMRATRILLPSIGKWAHAAITKHFDPLQGGNELTRAIALERTLLLTDGIATLRSMSAEAGRNLATFKQSIGPKAKLIDQLDALGRDELLTQARQIVDDHGGADAVDKWLQTTATTLGGDASEEGLGKFAKMVAGTGFRNAANMTVEWWINSLLSGLRTMTLNLATPLLASMYVPMERVTGGLLRGDREAIQSGFAQVHGLFRDSHETMKLGLEAFKKRRGILSPQTSFNDPYGRGAIAEEAVSSAIAQGKRTPSSFSPEVRGIAPDTVAGKIGRFLDSIVPIPSAIIAGTDEIVKQFNFRSVARDELTRDGLRRGMTPAQVAAYVEDTMEELIVNGQAWSQARLYQQGRQDGIRQGLSGVALVRHAEDYAREQFDERKNFMLPLVQKGMSRANEVTFQSVLEKGTIGRSVQDLVVQQPMLRLFALPFVKTPTNILKFAGQRVDISGPARALLTKKFGGEATLLSNTRNRFVKDIMSNDPLRKADAIGRVTMGFGALATFVGLAASGKITGRGPTDPERRGILEQAGWKPYSIKIGDTYVEYRRLDPWATTLGFAADLFDYANWADPGEQGQVETAMMAGVTSLLNSLTQASYLTGIRNFVAALTDPQTSADRFVQSFVGNFTVPQAAAQFTVPLGDENFRESRAILDAAIRRVPGLSDTLEPRRNVFGEPIKSTRRLGQDEIGSIMNVWMPVAYSEVSDDVVDRELALLRHGFAPPRPTKSGIDLLEFRSARGQTAFDRWGELQGQVEIRGRTIREELRRLVTSGEYQRLPSETLGNFRNPRVALVSSVIDRYRDAAFDKTLREYPALAARWRQIGGDRVRAFQQEVQRARGESSRAGILGNLLGSFTDPNSTRFRTQLEPD